MQFKVLALSLAVSACFASAAHAVDTFYYEGKGGPIEKNENVTADKADQERVLGGWYISEDTTDEMKAPLNSQVSVTGGAWNYISGGSYVKTSGNFELNSSHVVIDGKNTDAYYVVGGMAASNPQGVNFSGKSTHLTIKNGHFGSKELKTNVLEQMIVSGDSIKSGQNGRTGSATLEEANLVIENGTFDAVVIGGSVAYGYYETATSHTVNVNKVNMTITGGTFNEPIVVGGMAGGHNTKSTVGVANVSISGADDNLTLNHNIYTGSLRTDGNNQSASVGKVNLNIEHATIKGLFDTDVKAHLQDSNYAKPGNHWVYDTIETESAATTETHATLTNVKADNVQISNGSLTLGVVDNGLMSINTLSLEDNVKVRAIADGITNDAVKGDINSFLKNNIHIGNNALESVDITLKEGESVGEVTGNIVGGKLDPNTVVEKVNQKSLDVTNLVGMLPRFTTRIEMNDLRKRMGDLRTTNGTYGAWARYDGGKLNGQGLSNDFNKIQVGLDTTALSNDVYLGLAFSYTQGDVDGTASTADTDTYSLAGYGVWLGENGQFIDVIARVAKIKTDFTTSAYNADLDQKALSLSSEFGWRFDINDSFYVEPSVEATYTYINDESFKGTRSVFDIDSHKSLMGRVGTAFGWKLPDNRGDVYLRGGLVREFKGDSKLTVDNGFRTVNVDGKDTWFEYAVGGNYRLTDNTYVWADVERTDGGDIEVDWRATVGARYVF